MYSAWQSLPVLGPSLRGAFSGWMSLRRSTWQCASGDRSTANNLRLRHKSPSGFPPGLNSYIKICLTSLTGPSERCIIVREELDARDSFESRLILIRRQLMMTEQRRGEIALMYVKNRVRDKGIPCKDLARQIGNEAHHLGIPVQEVAEFVRILVNELTAEVTADLDSLTKWFPTTNTGAGL